MRGCIADALVAVGHPAFTCFLSAFDCLLSAVQRGVQIYKDVFNEQMQIF